MHPRNKHAGRYDLEALARGVPALSTFIKKSPQGSSTIDFADPAAVKALNQALLKAYYNVDSWDIPDGYLCPPVPGRADYVHHAADILAASNGGEVPRGNGVRVLDVGVGANLIYPIIGRAEYGWRFVGSDIDPAALASAREIVAANPGLAGSVDLRRQIAPAVLQGLLNPGELVDLSLCNPPFNASVEEASAGARRKWENLKRRDAGKNFGGRESELATPGGEAAFAWRMINESVPLGARVFLFTILISKASHVPSVLKALERVKPADVKTIDMFQGGKKSRLVAWTFLDQKARDAWHKKRWAAGR